jgi:predicted ATP-dependent endonuclease of OLD family
MKYERFLIQNYRGIQAAELRLNPDSKVKIITLVGLNESGKTTLLEAIHSFSPDEDNSAIFGPSESSTDLHLLIPKDRLANFSDEIIVSALLRIEDSEISDLADHLKSEKNFLIEKEKFPKTITIEVAHQFENSKFIRTRRTWSLRFEGRTKSGRKVQKADGDVWQAAAKYLKQRIPAISYYPTFIFEFPEKIYLSEKSDASNQFYKSVFQDILDAQGEGLNVEKHIVDRVNSSDLPANPLEFIASILSGRSNVKDQVDAVFFKASAIVTQVVFGRWNEIFREKLPRREVVIEWHPEANATGKHVYIQFFVKDGVNKYPIPDRSLGFRWFFCFLLFTQFRTARKSAAGIVFLFDEPASNLHSRAQEQLLASFPTIASGRNMLIYSTHSHYMINPHWLEQTFIVENAAVDYEKSVGDQGQSGPTSIKATLYREFVGKNPGKYTYFQPILDKLNYKPSLLEFSGPACLVEGKSDFYILAYFANIIFKQKKAIFPGTGAGTMQALIALFLGWGLPFSLLLDGDKDGKAAKAMYIEDFTLKPEQVKLLNEVSPGQALKIEKLLRGPDLKIISDHFGIDKEPNKKQILRYFAEMLGSGSVVNFSKDFKDDVKAVLDAAVGSSAPTPTDSAPSPLQ